VGQVQFFGSYYEVTLQLKGGQLTAKTSTPGLTPGSQVAVTVAGAGGWYLEA
jgi:hypothetical protein